VASEVSFIPIVATSLWFVAQTGHRAEQKACDFLLRKSIGTYVPRLLVSRRHGSRRWQTFEPLFPGYIFVQCPLRPEPELVSKVRWTPGVRRLLGDPEQPSILSEEIVAYLKQREGERGFITARSTLAPGTPVRFTSGPFTLLEGIIERPGSGHDRVRVLLHLLAAPVSVEVDVDMIEVR
jgi:transcription antitermination factor NusG